MTIDYKLAAIGTINIVLKSKLAFKWLLDDVYFEINEGLIEICCEALSSKVHQEITTNISSIRPNLFDKYQFFHLSGKSLNGEDEYLIHFNELCPRLIREPLTQELIQKIVNRLINLLEPDTNYPKEILDYLLK
jgi:hypothetical protein